MGAADQGTAGGKVDGHGQYEYARSLSRIMEQQAYIVGGERTGSARDVV